MAFFLFIAVVVFIVAMIAVKRAREDLNRSWGMVADHLKLAQVAADWNVNPRIDGKVSGYPVSVDIERKGSGQHKRPWTRFRIGVPTLSSLSLKEEGFLSSISKAFGTGDIEIGESAFDERFNIKGQNADAIRKFLTPARRASIRKFFTSHRGTMIDSHGITWSRQGKLNNPSQMLAIVRDMLVLTRELDVGEAAGTNVTAPPVDADFSHESVSESPEPEPEPEPDLQASIAGDGAVDLHEFCNAVFKPGALSFQASQAFDSRYKGQQAAWSGVLRAVEPYTFDFVFGPGKGVKATFAIHKVEGSLLGDGEVKALLQLPADTLGLEESVGDRLSFTGTLTKVDGLMRKVFLANGQAWL